MGNMELAWIKNNIGGYNLDQTVMLMEELDARLLAVKQQVEECPVDNVLDMLELLAKQNNLELALELLEEHLDTIEVDFLSEDELQEAVADMFDGLGWECGF